MNNAAVLFGRGAVAAACVLAVWFCPSAADKKPDVVKPDDKKPEVKKPEAEKPLPLVGVVKAIADDGNSFTLKALPTKKGDDGGPVEVRLGDRTKITDGKNPAKLTVGQFVSVWLDEGKKVARAVQVGKPSVDKKPPLVGVIKALADDGKSFTLQPAPTKKDEKPAPIQVKVGDRTKVTNGKAPAKLAVGEVVSVWLEDGKDVAITVQLGKPTDVKPVKKLVDDKPVQPRKPRTPSKPVRDPAPLAGVIDDEIGKHLTQEKIPASPPADDAEFLRRVTLDLTGRIPTYQRAVAFLDSKDSDKRRKVIDELLDSREYAEHFGTVWKNLIAPYDGLAFKGRPESDPLATWLADQFDDNRGWDAIVTALLTAEGNPRENVAAAFMLVNGENGQPQPNKAAAAATRLFLGVNVGCAECHNHPFAKWKQSDFWATAAFFGKVRMDGPKGGPLTLAEVAVSQAPNDKKALRGGFAMKGTAIVVPEGSGKVAGQAVKARFLGGDEATLDENKPFRPRFAAWATGKDNPYFAQAAVNRAWAHFLGRGFVNPPDGFDDNNQPSHPALLRKLAAEFAASGFDLKHLARVITTSKTYQRSSRPAKGNEDDETGFSRVAVKVLTPEAFFDSVAVVMAGSRDKSESRELFVRSSRAEVIVTDYTQGIPHQLRLMNVTLLNRAAPVVDRLATSRVSHAEAITTLYLTALSRRPTAEETKLMEGYLSRRGSDREGYRGVLWILMNSSEFALNH